MARKLLKTRLGKHFSEGARQLWLLMFERGWNQKELAQVLDRHNSVISRWIYGERRPDRDSSLHIYTVFNIDPVLWNMPSQAAFVPPGAQEAV